MSKRITLRAMRADAGFTQGEIAKLLGVQRKTIVIWEKSPEKMKPYQVLAFARACGFDIDDVSMPAENT